MTQTITTPLATLPHNSFGLSHRSRKLWSSSMTRVSMLPKVTRLPLAAHLDEDPPPSASSPGGPGAPGIAIGLAPAGAQHC
eukprot:4794052-Amphidinium_carterae.1